jgi:GT2 family glycosyltransferase
VTPAASVVFATRNRRDELRRALASTVAQSVELEIIVLDDASSDGTAEMVAAEFPAVRLHRSDEPRGSIVHRNLGAELATAPVFLPIDDDTEFSSADVVAQTLREFDHPRVGAVAIPLVDVPRGNAVLQRAPEGDRVYAAHAYVGAAVALRRDLFLRLGGYRAQLVHQGEEPEYAIRLLDAGYVTRLGRADPIYHYESPRRDVRRWHINGARNQILLAWYNVPMPFLPLQLLATAAGSVWFGIRTGTLSEKLIGVAEGLRERGARRPVRRSTYLLYRRLRARGCLPLDEIEARLP